MKKRDEDCKEKVKWNTGEETVLVPLVHAQIRAPDPISWIHHSLQYVSATLASLPNSNALKMIKYLLYSPALQFCQRNFCPLAQESPSAFRFGETAELVFILVCVKADISRVLLGCWNRLVMRVKSCFKINSASVCSFVSNGSSILAVQSWRQDGIT